MCNQISQIWFVCDNFMHANILLRHIYFVIYYYITEVIFCLESSNSLKYGKTLKLFVTPKKDVTKKIKNRSYRRFEPVTIPLRASRSTELYIHINIEIFFLQNANKGVGLQPKKKRCICNLLDLAYPRNIVTLFLVKNCIYLLVLTLFKKRK